LFAIFGMAHVDIDKICARRLQRQRRAVRHDGRVIAEDLRAADAERRFVQQTSALFILIDQRTGRDHFRHRHRRAQFRADRAERQIRYPRHRRKHQIARDFQISQFHAYSSKVSS